MWLYLPPSCVDSACAPASADSTLDSVWPSAMPTGLSLTSSGKPLPARSWSRVSRTAAWIRRLSGMTLPRSTAARGVASWISSLAASPASRGAMPDGAGERTTSAGSGPRFAASFARFDRDSSSWRTCQGSLAGEGWSWSSPISWPTAGSVRNGFAFLRRPLARASSGSAPSSWPTATWDDAKGSRNRTSTGAGHDGVTLSDAGRLWRTPTDDTRRGAADPVDRRDLGHTVNPQDQVRGWATPRAGDWRSGEISDAVYGRNSRPLSEPVNRWTSSRPDPETPPPGSASSPPTPRLNPRFVAWLMGLPPDWCWPEAELLSLAPWATASSHSVQRLRSCFSRSGSG